MKGQGRARLARGALHLPYRDARGRESPVSPIRELARLVCPSTSRHRALALLGGYFDEGGIHAGSRAVVMAGFVGDADEWARVEAAWLEALTTREAPYFHYSEMRGQLAGSPFERWETWRWRALADACAKVLKDSKLEPVAAGFMGDWQEVVGDNPAWARRFPAPYHFVFEMAVVQMQRFAVNRWDGETISMIFDRQQQYHARALEIIRVHQANGLWPHISHVGYDNKHTVRPLQCADMIANEVYRWLSGGPTLERSNQEALLSLLMPTEDSSIPGGVHDVKTARAMMQPRRS